MKNINKKIGGKIRELRKERKLSIEDLADKSGLHFTYISRIELGKHSPTIEAIEKIANALDVKIGLLFESIETTDEKQRKEIYKILNKYSIKELEFFQKMTERYNDFIEIGKRIKKK